MRATRITLLPPALADRVGRALLGATFEEAHDRGIRPRWKDFTATSEIRGQVRAPTTPSVPRSMTPSSPTRKPPSRARGFARPTVLSSPAARLRDGIVVIKLDFKATPENWASQFSQRHPALEVEVGHVVNFADDDHIGEFEIVGPRRDWTDEIAASRDVVEADLLEFFADRGRYRVRYRHAPVLLMASQFRVLLRPPSRIKNGMVTVGLVAWRSQLRNLMSALARAGREPRLVSLGPESSPAAAGATPDIVLTSVQRALFRHALSKGYYEVPRRISLTQLARDVTRSKSSVSRTLAIVEHKLAHSAAAGKA